jgi:autotransporter-associated beta strand protein
MAQSAWVETGHGVSSAGRKIGNLISGGLCTGQSVRGAHPPARLAETSSARRWFRKSPALLAAAGASLVGATSSAFANCDVTQPSQFVFTCAVNTTTVAGFNTLAIGATNLSSQGASFPASVDVNINQGVLVNGGGLSFDMITTSPETITNNGAVKNTIGSGAGLSFVNRGGGAVSYFGNGNASSTNGIGLSIGSTSVQIGTPGTPVVPNFSGTVDGMDISGHVAIYLNGGTINGGLQGLETGTNLAPISLTGHTTISAGAFLGLGIGFVGSVALNSDANIGDAAHPASIGILTIPNITGPVAVTHGTGGNIFANKFGIEALGAGNVDVTNNGAISVAGGMGVAAGTQTGTGNVTVLHNGTISTVAGTSQEVGIFAFIQGGTGNVAVTVNGNISTSSATNSIGVDAANFAGNVTVDIASGASIATGGTGIIASAIGGTTTINVLGTVSGTTAARFTGTMNVGNGGTTGTIIGDVLDRGTLNFNRSDAVTYSGSIFDTGIVQQNGSGILTLSGVNTYTGATNVNAGTLSVNGSIASSSLTTVNAGATLGGNGTVGNTLINGGTLAPGNSIGLLTVQGSLVFTAASSYMVEVSPANADRVNVTGTTTLGGATLKANFAPGAYVSKQYTIVNATGGVAGTFNSFVTANLPSNVSTSIGYDAHNAFLNLALNFSIPGGLSGNQQNTGNALTNFFNSTGGIPLAFATLSPAGLTQASGETATGSQQTTFSAMTQFITTLLDPFIAGRIDGSAPAGAMPFVEEGDANTYASTGRKRSGAEREAYAAIYNKAPPRNPSFDARWSVWAAGFGGAQTTDGNVALGSNNTASRVFGMAAGADYVFSPRTIAGFALAGGGTNFGVVNGGNGRSDLFQAGAFVRHTFGAAYITGVLAYGWQDVTTDRTVTIAGIDRLRAQFNANAYSGRVEGGYRFITPWIGAGLTPYAAAQFTTFDLPAYAEQVLSGANTFALGYAAKNVTVTRSELGLRADKSFAMQDAILTLRGRAAWAHDYNNDRSIAATFQTLPGASFVVNGAAQASDSALTTGSAEVKWRNGFSLAGTFEGEFSNVTRSYAGKAVARYAW